MKVQGNSIFLVFGILFEIPIGVSMGEIGRVEEMQGKARIRLKYITQIRKSFCRRIPTTKLGGVKQFQNV